MANEFTFTSLFYLAAMVFGLCLGVVLWNFPRTGNTSNKMLSVIAFSSVWGLFIAVLIETHFIFQLPHFYRTGQLSILIVIPFSYFYVRCIALGRGLGRADLVHGLPMLLYLIDYTPFYLLSSSDKVKIIAHDLADLARINLYDDGWLFPPWVHLASRYVLMAIYWVMQARVQYKIYFAKAGMIMNRSATLKTWLVIFTSVQLLAFTPLLLFSPEERLYWVLSMCSIAILVMLTGAWLLFKPEILYGTEISKDTPQLKSFSDASRSPEGGDPASITTLILHMVASASEDEKKILLSLHKIMHDDKRFLEHKYSINNLGTDLAITPHLLSHFLNRHLQMSFPDFLNRYRIEYCVEKMKNGEADRFKLEALAFDCGFNNRNSFRIAFKRFTGRTPSDYIQTARFKNRKLENGGIDFKNGARNIP